MGRVRGVFVLFAFSAVTACAADLELGGMAGYKGGFGFQVTGSAHNFARGFPFGLQFGVGFSSLDPGSPEDARKIFINDATDGTPQKSGHMWDFRLDFLYRFSNASPSKLFLFAGPRFSMFTGNFVFVGGNEDFDVTSNQWGLGLGAKGAFPISNNVDFVLTGGCDVYFVAKLSGHDTSYSPNGETVNGRKPYVYADADAAINQAKFQPFFMIGLGYNL